MDVRAIAAADRRVGHDHFEDRAIQPIRAVDLRTENEIALLPKVPLETTAVCATLLM